MPIYNRVDQAISAFTRLRVTAGVACSWIAVGGHGQISNLQRIVNADHTITAVHSATRERLSYWEALQLATIRLSDDDLVCAIASDVLPCTSWLKRASDWYMQHERDDYMIGFNGDGHTEHHACHFMVSMARLKSIGGWPVWYDHNYGDTELCARALELKRFYKHPYSILYHNHPYSGGTHDDVYSRGQQHVDHDAKLFYARSRNQWKS